jgi:hypothetical protein
MFCAKPQNVELQVKKIRCFLEKFHCEFDTFSVSNLTLSQYRKLILSAL